MAESNWLNALRLFGLRLSMLGLLLAVGCAKDTILAPTSAATATVHVHIAGDGCGCCPDEVTKVVIIDYAPEPPVNHAPKPPAPRPLPIPDDTPRPPAETPDPRPPAPVPDERPEPPHCNQGQGNGPEGCDPGHSNHGDPDNSHDEHGGKGKDK